MLPSAPPRGRLARRVSRGGSATRGDQVEPHRGRRHIALETPTVESGRHKQQRKEGHKEVKREMPPAIYTADKITSPRLRLRSYNPERLK